MNIQQYCEQAATQVMEKMCIRDSPKTAAEIVNTYSEKELYRIIRDYGEDKFAKNIAKHIVKAREKKPLETTGDLNRIIREAVPAKVRCV